MLFRSLLAFLAMAVPALAQDAAAPADTLFRNVRIFDGRSDRLTEARDLLVRDNRIADIGSGLTATAGATVVEGRGRTLMPGLIDVHVHLTFSSMPLAALFRLDLTPASAEQEAAKGSEAMLLRGFTSVRDAGGPVFGLKAGIDRGRYRGPRIRPSGATISQTSGHGDFVPPTSPRADLPASNRAPSGWGRPSLPTVATTSLPPCAKTSASARARSS